jgi:hypothetical protein
VTIKGLPISSSLIATTLIAALIWFVAEGQTLSEVPVELTVALAGQDKGDGAMIVRPVDGAGLADGVTVHLTGSNSRVDALRDELGTRVLLTVGQELPSTPGPHSIDLRDALRELPMFRGSGVTISSVVPERLDIEVDRLETAMLTLRPEIGAELDTASTMEPSEVTLTGPASLVQRWLAEPDTSIPVRVNGDRLSGLTPGITHQITVPIELPPMLKGQWATRLTPPQTTVSLRLRSRTSSFTVRELPIRVLLPPEAFARWIVELPEQSAMLRDVVFTGPEASIERISNGAARPGAVIELSLTELEQGVGSKPARIIDLPPGVTYQVASAIVNINVRRLVGIDPNETAPATPPAGTPAGTDPANSADQPTQPTIDAGDPEGIPADSDAAVETPPQG